MRSAHGQIAGQRGGASKGVMRKRSLGLASVLVVLMIAIATAMPIPSLGGASIAVAAIQRAKSFVELMHQRSPGKRLVGHLVKTKHKKLAAHERALPKIRRLPPKLAAMPSFPAVLPAALVDLVAPPIPMEMASLEGIPVGPFEAGPIGPPGFFLPPPGGFILPPTQTPTSPPPPVITPPIVPEAVPEPGSWILILLGFGLTGWSLRRSRLQEQTAA